MSPWISKPPGWTRKKTPSSRSARCALKATASKREWSTLIHPGRRIPPFITQLTGITDQMVLQAPSIREVLPDLTRLAGNAPILGHNVRFDLSFLRKHGVLKNNTVLDTYEMAAVLLPNAGRYNLGALAQALGVPYPATHRALDDAQATRGVFLRLYEEALAMPLPLLAEIVHLAEGVEWGGYWPFRMALRERSTARLSRLNRCARPLQRAAVRGAAARRRRAPLQPVEEPQPLDAEEVASILEPGGIFAHHFPHFEYRPQQVEMLRAVTEALSEGRHLLVEAGTGTGKSMAYLIPAALWAIQNNRRVVISTNTINLQDQLINKDIPDLCDALGMDLRAVVLKGRCQLPVPAPAGEPAPARPGNSRRDARAGQGAGLAAGHPHRRPGRDQPERPGRATRCGCALSAEDEGCTTENCLKRTGGACPFFRMRQAAQSAHILIVNHALLLADVATGNRVLPEYDYLIVDEAHHLEDATTNALSFHVTHGDIERTLRELGGPNAGVLGWLLTAAQPPVLTPGEYAALNHLVQRDHRSGLPLRKPGAPVLRQRRPLPARAARWQRRRACIRTRSALSMPPAPNRPGRRSSWPGMKPRPPCKPCWR